MANQMLSQKVFNVFHHKAWLAWTPGVHMQLATAFLYNNKM